MALHQKLLDDLKPILLSPIYARPGEAARAPRHTLPDDEMAPDTAYQFVRDELMLDGNARLNLATFVTTWMEPQAERLMADTFDKNMIDKDEYPRTAELEQRCVNMLSRLWSSPAGDVATGTSTTGSSEAAMLAGMALKWRWKARQKAAGQAHRPAEHGHGRQRAGLLGQVLPLLGGRAPAGAHGGRHLPPHRRPGRPLLRREHHRRGGHPRLHLRRLLRAGRGDLLGARPPPGRDRPRRAGARGRGVGRLRRPLHRPRPGLGLPAAAGAVDQRLGPQVRARLPGRGVGHLA